MKKNKRLYHKAKPLAPIYQIRLLEFDPESMKFSGTHYCLFSH